MMEITHLELFQRTILTLLDLLCHRPEVHGLLDNIDIT